MKKFIGYTLLILLFGSIFYGLLQVAELKIILLAIGAYLLISAIIFLGVWLIMNDD